MSDSRFVLDDSFAGESEAESKFQRSRQHTDDEDDHHSGGEEDLREEGLEDDNDNKELGEGMYLEGFAGPSEKVVKPLTPEALARFKAAQERTGVVYISRIPPGMRPTKVRHLMGAYGEVGRVYLQPEGVCARHSSYPGGSRKGTRPQADISSTEIHYHEEGALHRRLGGVQGQESRAVGSRDAQCPTYRWKEGVPLERRRMDYEVPA